jgi:putative DNA primase/helicase
MTTTCDICGCAPCANPDFCQACRRADARKGRVESPPPPVESKVAELAALSRPEYDRQRKDEAKKLGIKLATLDREVAAARAQAENRSAELPHWKVKPWEEPVDGAALLVDIERTFTRYAYLPAGANVSLALWTLHAWTMDAGDISPFIVLVSPTKRCGKTTVLIILYYLTSRSELASNISPSALFRYVETSGRHC